MSTGDKFYMVSDGGRVLPWKLTNAYTADDRVMYTDGKVYIAQLDIPVSTAWVVNNANWLAVQDVGIGNGFTPIGGVIDWFGNLLNLPVPLGWHLCDGAAINDPRAGALNGSNVPDLRGRVTAMADGTNAVDSTTGAVETVLQALQLPGHVHQIDVPTGPTGNQSANHTHVTDPAAFTSGNQNANHTHKTVNRYLDRVERILQSAASSSYLGSVDLSNANGGKSQTLAMDVDGWAVSEGLRFRTHNIDATSASQPQNHGHTINVPATTSTNQSANHTHEFNVPNFDSDSNATANNPVNIMQPTSYCEKIIRIF